MNRLINFGFSFFASLVLAVSAPFLAFAGHVRGAVIWAFDQAFPPPGDIRFDLMDALQPAPVIGRVEARAFAGRLLRRLTRSRSRAPESMAFVST